MKGVLKGLLVILLGLNLAGCTLQHNTIKISDQNADQSDLAEVIENDQGTALFSYTSDTTFTTVRLTCDLYKDGKLVKERFNSVLFDIREGVKDGSLAISSYIAEDHRLNVRLSGTTGKKDGQYPVSSVHIPIGPEDNLDITGTLDPVTGSVQFRQNQKIYLGVYWFNLDGKAAGDGPKIRAAFDGDLSTVCKDDYDYVFYVIFE